MKGAIEQGQWRRDKVSAGGYRGSGQGWVGGLVYERQRLFIQPLFGCLGFHLAAKRQE